MIEHLYQQIGRHQVELDWLEKIRRAFLWRSGKYEEIYLMDDMETEEAQEVLRRYFGFYNGTRRHQGLGYKNPGEVYWNGEEAPLLEFRG